MHTHHDHDHTHDHFADQFGGQRPGPRGPRGRRAAFADWGDGFDRGFGRGRGRGPRGGPGRGRARRGDVRAAILALLLERPMHGYEIIQELGQRTDGMWQPSPGSVYPALQLLEDEDLVVAASEGSGGKKQFSLTDTGRADAESRTGPAPWDHITKGIDPAVGQLREAVGQAFLAVKQVASAGTDDQKARAVAILSETRRKLYAILAEEPPADDTSADDIPADS